MSRDSLHALRGCVLGAAACVRVTSCTAKTLTGLGAARVPTDPQPCSSAVGQPGRGPRGERCAWLAWWRGRVGGPASPPVGVGGGCRCMHAAACSCRSNRRKRIVRPRHWLAAIMWGLVRLRRVKTMSASHLQPRPRAARLSACRDRRLGGRNRRIRRQAGHGYGAVARGACARRSG